MIRKMGVIILLRSGLGSGDSLAGPRLQVCTL